METSIITDSMKSSNISGDFIHISNNISNADNFTNTTNSQKLYIDMDNSKIFELNKHDLYE